MLHGLQKPKITTITPRIRGKWGWNSTFRERFSTWVHIFWTKKYYFFAPKKTKQWVLKKYEQFISYWQDLAKKGQILLGDQTWDRNIFWPWKKLAKNRLQICKLTFIIHIRDFVHWVKPLNIQYHGSIRLRWPWTSFSQPFQIQSFCFNLPTPRKL